MEKKKIQSLQAIRAVAFSAIFLSHLEIISGLGGWGVSVFFVLSGFLMSYSYEGRAKVLNGRFIDRIKFAYSKVKKLYLLHIMVMIIAVLISLVRIHLGIIELKPYQLMIQIVLNITLTQAWIPNADYYMSLNGVAWYLSVQLFLYFMYPIIQRMIKKHSVRKLIVNSLLIYVLMWIWVLCFTWIFRTNEGMYTYFRYVCPLLRLGDFWIGCNFGLMFLKFEQKNSRESRITKMVPKYTMFEVITIFLIIISIAINKYKANNFILEVANCSCLLFLPTSVMLICLFASNMGDLSRLSKNKILIYIGDLSPYGYMIHQMISICIVIVFTYILGTPLSIPVKSIMTAVITWMVICLYKKFETKVLIKEIS